MFDRRDADAARRSWRGLPVAALALGVVTALGLAAHSAMGYRAISILYLMAIMALPFSCSRLVVFSAAFLSALLWNFLFIPPQLTFSIESIEDILMFAAFFAAASVGGFLMTRLREKELELALREKKMEFLYRFTRDISLAAGTEGVSAFVSGFLGRHLRLDAALILDEAADRGESGFDAVLIGRCRSSGEALEDGTGGLYMPVVAQEKALGVLAVRNPDPGPVREELRDLLAALPGNIALVLERERLSEENARNKAAGESARLAKILLHHISHELRTPLTTIKGAVSGLLDSGPDDDPELRAAMLAETIVAADTLNVVVEDLLAMSRLEAGRLVPRTELTYLNELLGAALGSLGMDLDGRSIVLDPGVADLEIKADPALVTQVFRNVLRNFAAYTPAGSRLLIGAGGQGEDCAIWFSDNGPGVPEEELPLLFDTFYRGSRCQARQGCGLGLSICKGIVEAHRGSVQATRSAEGGLRMEILLPRGSEP